MWVESGQNGQIVWDPIQRNILEMNELDDASLNEATAGRFTDRILLQLTLTWTE